MRKHSKAYAIARMADCATLEALKGVWESLDPDLQALVRDEKDAFKRGLENGSNNNS
jgi:hypothetical protein